MRAAIDATQRGFTEVLAELPRITAEVRGERVIEGVFATRARLDGNDVGYDSIAAAGPHATHPALDAQRRPRRARRPRAARRRRRARQLLHRRHHAHLPGERHVLRRAAPGLRGRARGGGCRVRGREARCDLPRGARRRDGGHRAQDGRVGLPPGLRRGVAAAREPVPPPLHGARHEPPPRPRRARLRAGAAATCTWTACSRPGMVFTIEPGLYFQPDDLTVPAEFRGIGVRIEDDILVTADGAENLSAGIPRTADEVEAWVRGGLSPDRDLGRAPRRIMPSGRGPVDSSHDPTPTAGRPARRRGPHPPPQRLHAPAPNEPVAQATDAPSCGPSRRPTPTPTPTPAAATPVEVDPTIVHRRVRCPG